MFPGSIQKILHLIFLDFSFTNLFSKYLLGSYYVLGIPMTSWSITCRDKIYRKFRELSSEQKALLFWVALIHSSFNIYWAEYVSNIVVVLYGSVRKQTWKRHSHQYQAFQYNFSNARLHKNINYHYNLLQARNPEKLQHVILKFKGQ